MKTLHYQIDRLGRSTKYKVSGNVIRKDIEAVENNLRFQGQYYDQSTGYKIRLACWGLTVICMGRIQRERIEAFG